ncbi:MAG: hypothetical protein ACK4PC_02910 [Sphingopyxis sp.]
MLRPGFFLPPLMFTADELEALVLGARWVEGRQDGSLSRAAGLPLAKIAAASPDELKQRIDEGGFGRRLLTGSVRGAGYSLRGERR